MTPPARPFAAFDIDGTVVRGGLTQFISQEMCRRHLIPGADYPVIEAAEKAWQRTRSRRDSDNYVIQAIAALYGNLAGIEVELYQAILAEVLDRIGQHVFQYPLGLIEELRARGYFILAISGSEQRAVSNFCARHNFDDGRGADYEQRAGGFTGEIDKTALDKDYHLKQMIAKHNLTLAGSVAVGDSEIDVPMLEMVERPTAFNPNTGLRAEALKRSWPIVVEKGGLIYELEPTNPGYRLKT